MEAVSGVNFKFRGSITTRFEVALLYMKKRRSGLFFKIIMVIFIILYFNIILPSPKSSTSGSTLFKHRGQEVTDIHLAPAVLLFLMQSNADDVLFINKIAAIFNTQTCKTVIPKTTFINLYVFRPWCALTTINAP